MHLNKAARRLRDWSGSSGGKKGWSFCYPTVSEKGPHRIDWIDFTSLVSSGSHSSNKR